MARPKKKRIVACNPAISYFKPRGIPLINLEEVLLTVDEREALRLADLLGLSYEEAGLKMGISRATFGRMVQHARHELADALINGRAIRVEGGDYSIPGERVFICHECSHKWDEPCGTGKPSRCPACGMQSLHRFIENS